MKKIDFILILSLTAFLTAFSFAEDILAKLGISQDQAQFSVLYNITDDHFELPLAPLLPNIIQGDKEAAALELCAYIKSYCNSTEFKEAYLKKREAQKPNSEPPPTSKETVQFLKTMVEQMEMSIKDPNIIQSNDAEGIANMKKQIIELKAEIKASRDSTPNKTKWLQEYPENPNVKIKQKLQHYLDILKTVDFEAETHKNAANKLIFNKAGYELQTAEWKACFRAGKDVNMVVSQFVSQWLKELDSKK